MATRILVVDDSPTLRRVVSAILERHGYEVALASDGQDAFDVLSKGEVEPDLVLLDFVMPRMNGFQLCHALRSHSAALGALPIVLMSAKGDTIRDQFVRQTGALDAITKPFDAQALLAVVENALRRISATRARQSRLSDLDGEDVPTSTAGVPLSVPPESVSQDVETRRTHVARLVAERLALVAAETMTKRPGLRGAALVSDLEERLGNEAILEMVEAVRGFLGDSSRAILSGDLGTVPIGAVFQLLQTEALTGILVCRGAGVEIRATFRSGVLDLVQSSGTSDEFRLGRYFLEEGILTAAEIDEVLAGRTSDRPTARSVEASGSVPSLRSLTDATRPEESAPPTTLRGEERVLRALAAATQGPTPLGSVLLAAGKIDEAELRSALVKQSSELLYDVLRWTRGRFELRAEAPSALAVSAGLGLPVGALVMEGFRRVDEWRLIEGSLGNFDAVLARDARAEATLDVGALPDRERRVLELVDGVRSVRQLIQQSNMSSFDACRILAQLLEARVLTRR